MTREEAIEVYNGLINEKIKEAFEFFAPELAESEDERIRKFLVDILSHGTWRKEWPFGPNEVVAYLEKQKENPKSAYSIPSDCVSDAKNENEHNESGDFVFELRQIISRHWYADEFSYRVDDEEGMASEIMSLCEKQKEQKPESCDCSRDEESYTNGIHHVLMNPEAYGLIKQKPAEWSEEDEKMFDRLKEILNIADAELCKKLNGEAFLIGEAEFNYLKFGIAHCLSWLELRIKSLRPQPHWKPSEKQMEALNKVVNGEVLLTTQHKSLESLHDDLKSL